MDIRNFFGKKPIAKSKGAGADKPITKRKSPRKQPPKNDDVVAVKPSPKKKTKTQSESDHIVESKLLEQPSQNAKSTGIEKTSKIAKTEDASINTGRNQNKDKKMPSSPSERHKSADTSPGKRASTPVSRKTPKRESPVKPPIFDPDQLEKDSFDVKDDIFVPEALKDVNFCFTGIMEDLHRDQATEIVKILGGKVTGAVSGRTTYLVVGSILEDGREPTDGRKYKDAVEKGTKIVLGAKHFFGLCHKYQDLAIEKKGMTKESMVAKRNAASKLPTPTKVNPYAKKVGSGSNGNPYLKSSTSSNPYAKKSNPYAKVGGTTNESAPSNSVIKKEIQKDSSKAGELWVDRHAPKSTRDILGNQDSVRKLTTWLNTWERNFNKPDAYGKAFSNPRGPWKAALLSGPPGIGKTTTATLVAKEAKRDLREFNASDARSKKALQQQLGDLTGSQSLGFSVNNSLPNKKKQLRCIIMDEVDGMGAGDRGGTQELIQMIKKSKVPIICICNDRQAQSIKSLVPYCMDLRFKRPNKSIMANRAVRIAQSEGMEVERNAAEAIAESCGNDVRQVVNILQMWAQKKGSKEQGLSYQTLKERESTINKDEILRVGLFDAAKTIMEGRKGLFGTDTKTQVKSLYKRSDAFFVDYSFTGLLVQQNYLKVMQSPWAIVKKADNSTAELRFVERMHDAALSMSDYGVFEHGIRGDGNQNWGLLPSTGIMAVKTGYHAGGKTGGMLPGYPEFTVWLGKNSSRNKKQRLLSELHYHMNFKISGDSQQLRETYLPVFRERFLTYFRGSDRSDEANDAAIALMDDYGMSREDVMEKLDEFKMSKDQGFADLDSKQKAAFTRRWNQGSHRSQALVAEEMGISKPKKVKAKRQKDPLDMDAIDEDGEESESEEEDEEAELKKLQAKLSRKRGKKGVAKGKPAAKKSKKAK